jgi:phage gpG-like protein
MAGFDFRFEINNDAVRQRLMGYSAAARDLSRAMELIGISGMASTDMRFEREVGPDGQAWAALAPSTIKRKAKAGREAKLQWSGRLRASFTRLVDSTSVTWGTNVPYARAHQHGADISRYAQTVLNSFVSQRRVKRSVTRKDGTVVEYSGLLFARTGDKRVVAMARRVVGEGRIVIPARPFAGINDEERGLYVTIIKDHVLGQAPS